MKIAVIGGGAAGFFAAISCKSHYSNSIVTIFEKGYKLLSKVKISGGGRCNVTHNCQNISELLKNYPRGDKFLKKAFNQFQVKDTIKWFNTEGVELKSEQDGRMFPITDNSQTIVNALTGAARNLDIGINVQQPIVSIVKKGDVFELTNKEGEIVIVDKVIVASGGSTKLEGLNWLKELGHQIESPVPSLFTFNMPNELIKELMGVAVENVTVKVQSTKLKQTGPLMITHWGMSGPAILKTSAWGARVLSDLNYDFKIQLNWLFDKNEPEVLSAINEMQSTHHKRMVMNKNPFGLPARLWDFLLDKIELRVDITWGEIGQKGINKLINILLNDVYQVNGKTTFKDEFVTCGGVSLQDISSSTMESKVVSGLYFAGEVMDIDGVTGGFNFQAAWTTGYIAGKLGLESNI